MKTTVKIAGMKALDEALAELPRATSKNVMRRALMKAGRPMADDMKRLAPVDQGDLRASIGVGTRLSRRQAGLHRRMFKDDRASVEVFVGAGALVGAITQEFGTAHHPPRPFARPAFDSNKARMLETIKSELASEIDKAAKRLARRRARSEAKG